MFAFTLPFTRNTILILILFFTSYIFNTNANYNLPGHLQPLGSHRPPMHVDVLFSQLDPIEFFDNYVKASKPVLFKGAARSFPSFMVWKNDSYLK